jgi:hypothetical protein
VVPAAQPPVRSRIPRGWDPATCAQVEDGGNGAAMRPHLVGFLSDGDEVLRVAALRCTSPRSIALQSKSSRAASRGRRVAGVQTFLTSNSNPISPAD